MKNPSRSLCRRQRPANGCRVSQTPLLVGAVREPSPRNLHARQTLPRPSLYCYSQRCSWSQHLVAAVWRNSNLGNNCDHNRSRERSGGSDIRTNNRAKFLERENVERGGDRPGIVVWPHDRSPHRPMYGRVAGALVVVPTHTCKESRRSDWRLVERDAYWGGCQFPGGQKIGILTQFPTRIP